MARKRARIPLNVYINSRLVGRLKREATGAIDFKYDKSWLEWENAIPVSLSLPLREDKFVGDPVFAVFDNLLPDNESRRKRLAETSGAEGYDAYSLLAAVGRDCVGALQFLPDGADAGSAGTVDGRKVSDEEIAEIVVNLAKNPLGITDDDEFRISIAGAQEKTALLFWKNKWHVPRGTTATTHILKPQMGKLPNHFDLTHSVENEHLSLKLVGALGIPVAEIEIAEFGKQRVLVVERFDRLWTKDKRLLRVPQEDMCQALSVSPAKKYEAEGGPGIAKISELLKGSDNPEDDRLTFLRAQVIFWLLAAIDGHAKNFSIRLAPGGRFKLTPLYDVMSAQPIIDAKQIRQNQTKLAMAVGDERHYVVKQILPRHLIQTAAKSGIPTKSVDLMLQELGDSGAAAIDKALASLPKSFPHEIASSIADGAKARLTKINAVRVAELKAQASA